MAAPTLHLDPHLRAKLQALVAAIVVLLAMVTIPRLIDLPRAGWLAAVASTTVLGWLLARVTMRRPISRVWAVVRTLAFGAALGVLDAPVAFVASQLALTLDARCVLAAPVVAVLGAPFGLILGIAFGLVAALPVVCWHGAQRRPSAAAGDRAMAIAGAWLAMVAAGAAALGDARQALLGLGVSRLDPSRGLVVEVTACVLGGAGLAIAVVAVARAVSRRRFIARIAPGDESAWAMVESPQSADPDHGPPRVRP